MNEVDNLMKEHRGSIIIQRFKEQNAINLNPKSTLVKRSLFDEGS